MKKYKLFLLVLVVFSFNLLVGVKRITVGDFNFWAHPEELRDVKRKITNYPYICGNVFRNFCDFIFDETSPHLDVNKISDGCTIFVRNQKDFLDYFFKKYHPNIRAKYILITHNFICTKDLDKYKRYLNDNNIFAWFGKNMTIDHPKAFPIPLGIGNRYWTFGKKHCVDNIMKKLPKKDKLACMNFKIGIQGERRGPIRKRVFDIFKNKSFCYSPGLKGFNHYLHDVARSKFVLSPEGNGIDCHRTWEAMLLKTIPIITSSIIDSLFEDLPVLIINDWNEVTSEFLCEKYDEIIAKDYKLEKLYADYWLKKILEVHKRIRD